MDICLHVFVPPTLRHAVYSWRRSKHKYSVCISIRVYIYYIYIVYIYYIYSIYIYILLLYYIILYYTILYYIILCYIMLYYIIYIHHYIFTRILDSQSLATTPQLRAQLCFPPWHWHCMAVLSKV